MALVHAAVLAVQHKACGQQEQAAEGAACHCQPVCTGLGQSGRSSSSGFRLCILRHVLCGCGGVCGRSVSRCSDVLCRGIRGHRGRGGVLRLFGGVRLVGGVRGIVARHVRFTGFRGQFGQHHTLGLAALVNAADAVYIAVLFQRGLLVLTLRVQLPVAVLVLGLAVLLLVHDLRLWTTLVRVPPRSRTSVQSPANSRRHHLRCPEGSASP